MQRLLFDFLFFSLVGTVGVIAICTLQAGRQSDRKKKLHILCIGRDKIGHDFRSFLKLFFEVQKDIKNARISPDTIVTEPISCPVGTRLVQYSFLGIIDSVNNIIHFLTRIFCVLLK